MLNHQPAGSIREFSNVPMMVVLIFSLVGLVVIAVMLGNRLMM